MTARTDIDDLIEIVSDALERAFLRGIELGGDRMRTKIMQAASGGELIMASAQRPAKKTAKRARKGAIGELLRTILSAKPGLKIVEIEAAVDEMDEKIAIKSLGNELRRLEGKKYERDAADRWFLI